jgi:Pyridoxamine 5'-phosphate oxidase
MGKTFTEITDELRAFVHKQHIFFVATAPAGTDGHVNCSPKGLHSLRILGPTSLAYLDYAGSGAETIAHVRENGRMVIMLCAFEGPPKIVRFHGRGQVVEPGDPGFDALIALFEPGPGVRSVIRIELDRISDSCGYAVPVLRFERERSQYAAWAEKKSEAGLAKYMREKNAISIDGLPAMRFADPETSS